MIDPWELADWIRYIKEQPAVDEVSSDMLHGFALGVAYCKVPIDPKAVVRL